MASRAVCSQEAQCSAAHQTSVKSVNWKSLSATCTKMRCFKFLLAMRFVQPTELLSHLNCLILASLKAAWLPVQDPSAIALGATDANAIALPGPPSVSAPPPGVGFTSATAFSGVKPGMVFKTGLQGVGYYPDTGLQSSAAQTPAAVASSGMGVVPSGLIDL